MKAVCLKALRCSIVSDGLIVANEQNTQGDGSATAAFAEADLIPLSALQHFQYCPRQCALIHTEQIWRENQFTAEGRQLHERVDRPETAIRGALRQARALPLHSLTLGLVGQADLVCFLADPPGQPFPVEYKRGRPGKTLEDHVQLCAQALCLGEMLRRPVPEGALYYGKTHRRIMVLFDHDLEKLTRDVVAETRHLLASQQLPAARYTPEKCDHCSLIGDCRPRCRSVGVGAYFLRGEST
ncbi:MAG: CRISPR-associated protein Cas4 [Magnetococcus sp. WYHC-3]